MRSSPVPPLSTRALRRLATSLTHMLALTGVLLALLTVGGGQAAAQGTIITRDSSFNALTGGTLCTVGEDGAEACSDVAISVSPGKFGESTVLCVDVTTYTADDAVSENGCADVAATFAIDLDALSWATLAATPVDLHGYICEGKACEEVYTRTITLDVSWTATGELTRVKETLGETHGPCAYNSKIDGFVRDAAATVTIDGVTAGWGGNLQALDDKQQRRTNCG